MPARARTGRLPLLFGALLAAAVLAGAGCGGDSSGEADRLTRDDRAVVARAQAAIRSYCRKLRLFGQRQGPPPTASHANRTFGAVDRLIGLVREKPEARHDQLFTMRELLGAMVEDLEGTNCPGGVIVRLRQGLASLPSPEG